MASSMSCWSSAARIRAALAPLLVRTGVPVSRSFAVVGMTLWSGIADGAFYRVLDLDSIMSQSTCGCTVQLHFGFFVNRHGRDQVEFREGEITLRSHCLENRAGAQVLFFLRNLEGALRQIASLSRGINASSCLLQRIFGVAHFDPDLFFQLFAPQLSLPVLEFGTVLIRLRNPISDGNI